jgi:cytochrome b561
MYNFHSKFIHWLMGLLIIGMLFIGFFLNDFPSEQKASMYMIHKSTGLLLMLLVFIRLTMRFKSKYPSLPESTPKSIVYIAKLNVFALYLIMILMPLSGILMSTLSGKILPFFGLFSIPSIMQSQVLAKISYNFHCIGGYIFIILILAHVIGGLFHHFILKDNVLKRML